LSLSGRKEWQEDQHLKEFKKLPLTEKYFFEWGQSDSVSGTNFLRRFEFFGGWIVDPHWHGKFIPALSNVSLHYKLHGWSEERWVRRYGLPEAERVLRAFKESEAVCLTLSYSGKVSEAALFARRD
jgi:hypothetical protein